MADNKISLEVEYKDTTKKDFQELQKKGAFNSPRGAKDLAKLKGLFEAMDKIDFKNLKGDELTKFWNNLGRIRALLDRAGDSLTNYSKAYQNQQKKVQAANLKVTQAQDKQTEALNKQAEALTKYKKELDKSNYDFYDKASGKKIPKNNFNQISDLYANNKLKITNNGQELSEDHFNQAAKTLGLPELKVANEAVKTENAEVTAAKAELKAEKLTLSNTDMGGELDPLSKTVRANSERINSSISDAKDAANQEKRDQINADANSINETTNALNKQSSSLGKVFKQFTLYTFVLKSVKKAAREAVKTIKDLDKYLTEQAMVTGKTRRETYGLLTSYQKLAKQLGSTTKEVAQVATQYMRQGKSTADAMKLTEAAISAAKVAGISATESVNYLTTALNGFQLSANDAMKVSDKFAAIAAQSASSYEELAIALSKVAAQANLAGMSIDYTTALLAKGLETTREAPETIGTALKTVIARMREMGDYGKTLEDGVDFNNVESQLSYVGIQLKNSNGELRSTEEVLDELGKKWKDLSVNQQASIAKALAGTRQQSRLIAMMTDYERVIELQEISQRSAGTTMAQMNTYLQGMDAALNKVSVAWEHIVTTITNSEALINIINTLSIVLDGIAEALSNDAILIGTIILLSTIILTNITKRWELQKAELRTIIEKKKEENQQLLTAKKSALEKAKSKRLTLEELISEKQKTIEKKKQSIYENKNLSLAQKQAMAENLTKKDQIELTQLEQQYNIAKQEEKELQAEVANLSLKQAEYSIQMKQNAAGLGSIFGSLLSVLTPILTIMSLINMMQIATNKNAKKGVKIAAEKDKEEKKGLPGLIAKAYAKCVSDLGPVFGTIAFGAILAGIVAIAGFAIAAGVKTISGMQKSKDQEAENHINEMAAAINNLRKNAEELDTVTSKFEAIDDKVIKTKQDIEEMNDLLDSAADKLSEVKASDKDMDNTDDKDYKKAKERAEKGEASLEDLEAMWSAENGGKSRREVYNNKHTVEEKAEFLEKTAAWDREQANKLAKAQLQKIDTQIKESKDKNGEGGKTLEDYAEQIETAVNEKIWNQAENLAKGKTEEEKARISASRDIVLQMVDQMSAKEQRDLFDNEEEINSLINKFQDLKVQVGNDTKNVNDILTSDNYGFVDKVKAYQEVIKTFGADSKEAKAFGELYHELDDLLNKTGENTEALLEYIDAVGLTTNDIDTLKSDLKSAGFEDQWIGVLSSLEKYTDIETGVVDIQKVISDNFKDLETDSTNYKKVLNALEKAIGETTLNIGQQFTKTKNQISGVYETALKWNTMTSAEQAEYLSKNAALFKGNSNLYEAFQKGDLAEIERTLKQSESLRDSIQEQIKTINSQLSIERSRDEKDRDDFLIQYLEDQLRALQDEENFFKASLDMRIDLEQKQLNIYKEYLQKQQDALTSALEKRKDAYSEYFEAINQEEEDEEYETQAALLATNLSKLASSDNAASKQQTKELEKQLQELETERLKELRQRAQEAVLADLDDKVEEINKKFDKLLENNQNLLAAMLVDEQNKDDFVANMISSSISGMTANEAEKWLTEDFMTTFGSFLPKSTLQEIENKTTQYITNLTANGQNVTLNSKQQSDLYELIMAALQQIGYN